MKKRFVLSTLILLSTASCGTRPVSSSDESNSISEPASSVTFSEKSSAISEASSGSSIFSESSSESRIINLNHHGIVWGEQEFPNRGMDDNSDATNALREYKNDIVETEYTERFSLTLYTPTTTFWDYLAHMYKDDRDDYVTTIVNTVDAEVMLIEGIEFYMLYGKTQDILSLGYVQEEVELFCTYYSVSPDEEGYFIIWNESGRQLTAFPSDTLRLPDQFRGKDIIGVFDQALSFRQLKNVSLPKNTEIIGFHPSHLSGSSASIHGCLQECGYCYTFCEDTENVYLGERLRAYPDRLFEGTKIKSLPKADVKKFGYGVFLASKIKEACLPASVTDIYTATFENCPELEYVDFSSCEFDQSKAYYQTFYSNYRYCPKLETIVLPSTMKGAIILSDKLESLRSVYFDGTIELLSESGLFVGNSLYFGERGAELEVICRDGKMSVKTAMEAGILDHGEYID